MHTDCSVVVGLQLHIGLLGSLSGENPRLDLISLQGWFHKLLREEPTTVLTDVSN